VSPAEEIRAAAKTKRTAVFRGAMTATPAVAALLRAREALADWLDDASDGDDDGIVNPHALRVARHINATP
jgi:hypothetical protein